MAVKIASEGNDLAIGINIVGLISSMAKAIGIIGGNASAIEQGAARQADRASRAKGRCGGQANGSTAQVAIACVTIISCKD